MKITTILLISVFSISYPLVISHIKSEENSVKFDLTFQDNSSQKSIDSLKRKELLRESYDKIRSDDPKVFFEANKIARSYMTKIKDTSGTAATYWDLGQFYINHDVKDSAFYYFNKAQKLYRSIGATDESGTLLINMAIIQKNAKDFTGSEITTTKAIEVLKPEENYHQLYRGYNNLGILFKELEEYERSEFYYNKAKNYLTKEKKNKESDFIALQNNIGVMRTSSGNYKRAMDIFSEAMSAKENLLQDSPKIYAMLLDNYSFAKMHTQDTLGLYQNFNKALKIRENYNYRSGVTINYLHMAEYMLYQRDTASAIKFAENAKTISLEIQSMQNYLIALDFLSKLRTEKALDYSHEYIQIIDSLQNEERKIRNKFSRIRFETDEYINETKLLSEKLLDVKVYAGILVIIFLLVIIKNQRSRNYFINQQRIANEDIYNLIIDQKKQFEKGREEEKINISRELHDGILSKLFGIRLSLDILNGESDEASKKKRKLYIEEIKNVAKEIRLLSHKLNEVSYFGELNFEAVLEQFLDKNNTDNLKLNYSIDENIPWKKIDNNIKINLYRIIQEALTNIHKHAGASHASINLDYNGSLKLVILDNGIGMDLKQQHAGIGLKNINERCKKIKANLVIESNQNGTIISISIAHSKLMENENY